MENGYIDWTVGVDGILNFTQANGTFIDVCEELSSAPASEDEGDAQVRIDRRHKLFHCR